MALNPLPRVLCSAALTLLAVAGATRPAAADDLCDAAFQNCRTPLISLINAEQVRIDVSFWFMEDSRYSTAIINRWKAGVPVRIMMDSRANATYPNNVPILGFFRDAGIPMREKYTGGILHRKFMLFAGQNKLEFSGANYSPDAFVPVQPYVNYVDEAIYFVDDPNIVNSFKTMFEDMWTSTNGYRNYANVTTTPVREYPIYTKDPELNFPPGEDYANRAVARYRAETQANGGKIDVQMYRITDRRHSDAMIDAFVNRKIPVRLYTDTFEYRNVNRLWHSWNVDRMWLAGIPIKVPAHDGINHQKTVLLYGQGMTIFGSSNWTSASANSQAEHNIFTTNSWFFLWFRDQFERKWNNTNPSGVDESAWFVPLPPNAPVNKTPANGATDVPTTGQKLTWYAGPWAHIYDVYFGTTPNPPRLAQNLDSVVCTGSSGCKAGPSLTTSDNQYFTLPALQPGTTYYWKIVSKTAALIEKPGPIWSFTTAGSASPPPPPPGDALTIVLWSAHVPIANIHGNWTVLSDSTAAGNAALWNHNNGAAKIAPALATPTNYFEQSFTAVPGVAYHIWVRLRAEGNSLSNDSVHLQFTNSVDQLGSAIMRSGSTSSAEFVLQRGTSDISVSNWGWTDNGWGSPGVPVYFSATSNNVYTVRVQQREDGAIIDQIVLSPTTYFSAPPGPADDDNTKLPAADEVGGGSPPPPPPPTPSLPSGWTTADIGSVGAAGSASESNGTFTVSGSGADIWGTADAFRFAYVALPGDGAITARVVTVQNVNVWTKAGVMIRQSTTANAAHASIFVTPGKGVSFQRRLADGNTSLSTTVAATAPKWVKVTRSNGTLIASMSDDGTTWTEVGRDSVSLTGTVLAGLAITSHDNTRTASVTFDNVTMTTGA
jgi:phosphatidylserine/phosphatidylglycerophosphate/cardiolipin synthase-like enzyme/regulation of enolase protein 1 (concanavalin A-like superfamily)